MVGQLAIDVVRPPQPGLATPTSATPAAELALPEVYRAHHEFVWRSLYHLGLPREQVDDALQDAFIVVHRRLAEFDGRTSLRNWLYGIARRVASQYRRGAERSARRLRIVPPSPVAPDARDAARFEAAELVREFLDQLDDDKREVFLLAELEGMKGSEIAEALELNPNTVYARLRAARLRFEKVVARQRARSRREARG